MQETLPFRVSWIDETPDGDEIECARQFKTLADANSYFCEHMDCYDGAEIHRLSPCGKYWLPAEPFMEFTEFDWEDA